MNNGYQRKLTPPAVLHALPARVGCMGCSDLWAELRLSRAERRQGRRDDFLLGLVCGLGFGLAIVWGALVIAR